MNEQTFNQINAEKLTKIMGVDNTIATATTTTKMAIIIETCPKCGHDLLNEVIYTYPPIPRKSCPNCGWSWEGEQEEVIRVPFVENKTVYIPECCKNCPNYPINGGYTICACSQPCMTR